MAVLAMDSFDFNDVIPPTGDRYHTSGGSFQNTTTKWGSGNAANFATVGGNYELDDDQSGNVLICGGYFYIHALSATTEIFTIYDNTVNEQISLDFSHTVRKLNLNIGGLQFASLKMFEDTWYHIEWKIKVANSISTGECIVKVDGVEVLNITSGDTQARATDSVKYIKCGDGYAYTDDFYVLDTTGTWANDFLGPTHRIEALRPDGNGNYANFVGSDADSTDNYLHVDESSMDSDTTYTESSTVGHRDSYTFGNIGGSVSGNPLAVQMLSKLKKSGGNESRVINHFLRISSTDYDNTDTYPLALDTYGYVWDIYDQNPNTTAQWTEAQVNALEAGVEVTS